MQEVRKILEDFQNGFGQMRQSDPAFADRFGALVDTAYKDGALSRKQKELISVAIGAYNRCKYCIVVHVYGALEAGASREEILEAAKVAITFGGGPSMAYSSTYVLDALNEFEKDFKK